MTSEEQLRTALHDRLGPLLAELQPAPSLLDELGSRQRRHSRRVGFGVGASVAVGVVSAVVLLAQRPSRDNSAVVTPPPTAAVKTGAPLPGPTVTNPRTVVVPNVVGLAPADARAILQSTGLRLSDSSDTLAIAGPEVVVAQSPAGGSLVPLGSAVTLTIGVPDGGPSGSPAPTPAVGALLPDGSRLPVECALPIAQATVPSPDDTFLAYDQCGEGQFSLKTGRPVRYVSAAGLASFSVSPGGDVYSIKSAGTCGAGHAFVLAAGARTVVEIPDSGSPAGVWALSHSRTATAWAHDTCGKTQATTSVVIRDSARHVLPFQRGLGVPGVRWTALSNDGRLAVSYARRVGEIDCALTAGASCPNIVTHGIAVVTATDTSVPAPQLLPKPHCEFDQTAWSGATLVVVEWCDGPRGSILQYPGTLQLVRLDPGTGTRLSASDLPTDWGQVVDGLRTLSDGDVLVAMGSAKFLEHLLRLHGGAVTELDVPRCADCSWGEVAP